jgi:hypothetical protein
MRRRERRRGGRVETDETRHEIFCIAKHVSVAAAVKPAVKPRSVCLLEWFPPHLNGCSYTSRITREKNVRILKSRDNRFPHSHSGRSFARRCEYHTAGR